MKSTTSIIIGVIAGTMWRSGLDWLVISMLITGLCTVWFNNQLY